MDSYKLAIKWFARDSSAVAPEALVPVFHSWIQNRSLPNHQAIDVANYAHVVHGPGVVLVAHEGNFAYDLAEGRPGLLYTRQRPLSGTFEQRLSAVCAASLAASAMLEQTPGIAFHTDRVLFRINDRLLAPNTVETFKSVEPELNTFFSTLLGAAVKLEHLPAVDRPFEVAIQGSATSASLGSLRSRIK
jgi:hypothetical protein